MKTQLLLSIICCGLGGCRTTQPYNPNADGLRDAKAQVMQLRRGMKRETAETILRPLPYLCPEIKISGVVGVQYLLQPGVWAVVKYDSDGSLIFSPRELIVNPSGHLSGKYKHVPLSQIH